MTSTRRTVLAGAAAWCVTGHAAADDDPLAALEARSGGRLGVAAVDTGSGRQLVHRADDRFAMCSTFKLVLVAAVLARVDRGELALSDRVPVTEADLVPYAPVTERKVGRDLSLEKVCEAAMTVSDNVAANLLLARVGGPEGWTRFVRNLGDETSRLDRIEVALNENLPGDPRDTTTPAAMLGTMQAVLLGDTLSDRSRDRLVTWAIRCKTGDARLRAGFPSGWRVGDKTGTSTNGAANDLGIAWPPGRAPIVVAAYHDHADSTAEARSATLAEVARIVTATFAA